MIAEPLCMHVVSHSHWDREWHSPFQVFRIRLLKMIDTLLAILERTPEYRSFVLDGQSVILEDYPEVARHRLEELRKRVQEGRILVGPWYVLADEFLVSVESLIRNLRIGREVAQQFGSVMPVGYLPDAFGHTGAMPTLLSGFGIDTAVLWRGVPPSIVTSEFCWRSPDGSETLVIYLPLGYGNGQALPADPEQLVIRLRHLQEQLEPLATGRDILIMNGGDHALPQSDLPEIIRTANERLQGVEVRHSSLVEYVNAASGHWNGRKPPVVEGELRSPARAHLLPGVLSTRIWIKQRNAAAQLLLERWAEPFAAWAKLSAGQPTSAEIPDHALEPLIEQAWRYLLHNHPHDSICGCGVDQVHAEMRNYFDWTEQIGETVVEESFRRITARIDTVDVDGVDTGHAVPIVVFNSLSGPRTDYVESAVVIPAEASDVALVNARGRHFPIQVLSQRESTLLSAELRREELLGFLGMIGAQPGAEWTPERMQALESMLALLGDFQMERIVIARVEIRACRRPDAVLVEVGVTDRGEHNYRAIAGGLSDLTTLAAHGDVTAFQFVMKRRQEVRVGFVADDLPGFGYKTFYVVPGSRSPALAPGPTRPASVENEYFIVTASEDDASLTVIDKRTGTVLSGVNRFVDSGDAGDEYNYSPPASDRVVDRSAQPPSVAIVEHGPVRRTIRSEQVLRVPASLTEDRRERSSNLCDLRIVSEICLYANVPRIDFRTEIENVAQDHRLRVHFPTRISTNRVIAEAHFGSVERPAQPEPPAADFVETPVGTAPQQAYVAVTNGGAGVLVANRGLPEYEVLPGEPGATIALTLIRAVGWLSRDDLQMRRGHAGPALETPGAQVLGHGVYEYSLIPFAGDWRSAIVHAHRFTTPARAFLTTMRSGILPTSQSFLRLEPESLVVSAIKPAWHGSGVVVRIYNLLDEATMGKLTLALPVHRAWLTNLAEDTQLEELRLEGQAVQVPVGPRGIATVRFETPSDLVV